MPRRNRTNRLQRNHNRNRNRPNRCRCHFFICVAAIVILFMPEVYTEWKRSQQEALDLDFSADVFLDPGYFLLDYEEMEREFKIYVYKDRDLDKHYLLPRKLTRNALKVDMFFKNLKESRFYTENDDEAHLFLIPIETHRMQGESFEKMASLVQDYVKGLISKYKYWNRTQGADHFFVNCHEIGVIATKGLPLLEKAIQVVCASGNALEFMPHKDIVLPAEELQPNMVNDISRFGNFCSCNVAPFHAACIAEAILEGCVPVVSLSNHDFPFNDTLDWTKFSAIVSSKKDYFTATGIEGENFTKLHDNLKKVQKHFKWNSPPVKFDAFHMIMYKLWMRTQME